MSVLGIESLSVKDSCGHWRLLPPASKSVIGSLARLGQLLRLLFVGWCSCKLFIYSASLFVCKMNKLLNTPDQSGWRIQQRCGVMEEDFFIFFSSVGRRRARGSRRHGLNVYVFYSVWNRGESRGGQESVNACGGYWSRMG